MQPAAGDSANGTALVFRHFNLMEAVSNRQEMDIEHLIY
ncbi:hypothetical protein T03_15879 [Trichinella britovi]|uniref:Uncharacterized protein n=1 Tax=Trichinella britovi TaxID=45882 RepID=A0A0V0ZUE0_TRIBR|nr:hypothetical protein T03_15879 [Trichinella britovi]